MTRDQLNRLPPILVCAKALEELIEHSGKCSGVVVPRINERHVIKLQRSLCGEYRAKHWEWYALTSETESNVQYLISICPINHFSLPIRGIPACATCGVDNVNGVVDFSREKYSSNFMLDKVFKLRDFYQENCRYMAPIYVSIISANAVVVFRVSHSFSHEQGSVAHCVPPATVAFATDWWMQSISSDNSHRKNVFQQYTRIVKSAAKDGFIALDATPFNMILLLGKSNDIAPRLVWPACLTWYFVDDSYVIQPSILNTVDSCCFTLFIFRKLPKKIRPLSKSVSLYHKKNLNKQFAHEQNLSNTLLAQEFNLVNQRSESLNVASEVVDSMLLLERAAHPLRSYALLTVKSLAVNYITQYSISIASFMLMGFGELARKPSAIALSDRTREYCIDKTPCNLRHIFSVVNPASASYDVLHRFVCVAATQATEKIVEERNKQNVFKIVFDFISCSSTQEIVSFVEQSLKP